MPCMCSWQAPQAVPPSVQTPLERAISAHNVTSPSHHVLQADSCTCRCALKLGQGFPQGHSWGRIFSMVALMLTLKG